jgi:hypothetical protein
MRFTVEHGTSIGCCERLKKAERVNRFVHSFRLFSNVKNAKPLCETVPKFSELFRSLGTRWFHVPLLKRETLDAKRMSFVFERQEDVVC